MINRTVETKSGFIWLTETLINQSSTVIMTKKGSVATDKQEIPFFSDILIFICIAYKITYYLL